MQTNFVSVSPYSYGAVAHGGNFGKLYFPVNPASVIYAQFDHISGVAASGGQSGVSVSKLQILNSLINNLTAMKSKTQSAGRHLSAEQVDILIDQYQQQMAQAVQQPQAQFMLAGAQPMVGELFSISA